MNEVSSPSAKVCAVCGARYPSDALFCPSDGTPLQTSVTKSEDPYIGQEISGHIEIKTLAGVGAMGRVYRAFQKGIDRDVAVKILHRELSANAQLVSRFTREAKVASRLQHPNVVQVLLAGQLPDRALYMVMEYLDGLSLQSALAAAGGALPLPRALHIVLQLAEAVGEAHLQGIVHRDLKPENVMLIRKASDQDFVKVLDFGIARINWGEQSVATAAGLIFGTARYISPEGAQGNAVGPPSDVYSIAVLLYQMLSGRTPFEGDQAVGLLVQQIHDAPPDLKSIERARYVPDPLAQVIMDNLAKDPKKREPDARSFGHAILDAARQAGLSQDDISRPILRRPQSAMQLPPVERTKQHELTPDILERLTPSAPPVESQPKKSNGANGERPMVPETVKWEPPAEFHAKLAEAARASSTIPTPTPPPPSASMRSVPTPTPSRPSSGVDQTLDDESVEPYRSAPDIPTPSVPVGFPESQPRRGSVPKTMPGDPEPVPRTHYATPTPPPAHRASAPSHPERHSSYPPPQSTQRSSRGILFVAICFVVGAMLAAGIAWKMGRLGGEPDEDRFVARATDAMFKNRFIEPPGENVKDITDEGLRRWPNDRRLLEIRGRVANELTTKALAQRASGDVAEALRLARLAHELDPGDAASKRLVDQYEAELGSFASPTTIPLTTPPSAKTVAITPPVPSAQAAFKVLLDTNVPQPRVGQTVELTARIAPAKATFAEPTFTIVGPGLGGGVRMPAQSPAGGVFKAGYAFLEAGKYDITFTTLADGKPLHAARALVAGTPPPPPPPTTAPTPPPPPPSASVKWM